MSSYLMFALHEYILFQAKGRCRAPSNQYLLLQKYIKFINDEDCLQNDYPAGDVFCL